MKKIVAFLLSASMCLSLLTVLTPAFGFAKDSGIAVMSFGGPDDDEDDEVVHAQNENH